jgi:putative copper export protein
MWLLEQTIAAIHILSAGAWFGSLVYRTFFVDPKAHRFFDGGSGYERFSLGLAHGMRGVVLAALLTCGLSGFALVGMRWSPADGWQAMMVGKTGLWVVASAVFAYVSWVFWPRRVFSTADQWRGVRRQGLVLSLAMIAIAGVGIVLGQLSQAVRVSNSQSVVVMTK